MRGATSPGKAGIRLPHYFNPRSSCEERLAAQLSTRKYLLFQSTLLMRGATFLSVLHALSIRNFNPRSSCEERHGKTSLLWQMAKISIHAPHARSDDAGEAGTDDHKISIHAPHARSDACQPGKDYSQVGFQSTLLMRGATVPSSRRYCRQRFQSTLLMRGATDWEVVQ